MRATVVFLALLAGLPQKGSDPPGYMLTRAGGMRFPIESFERQGDVFKTIGLRDHRPYDHPADAVVSIVPMSEKRADAALAAPERPSPPPSGGSSHSFTPRVAARTEARTSARTVPRRKHYAPQPYYSLGNTSMGATTPTGLPLFMGPKGGMFHYSAGGNKVYQSH